MRQYTCPGVDVSYEESEMVTREKRKNSSNQVKINSENELGKSLQKRGSSQRDSVNQNSYPLCELAIKVRFTLLEWFHSFWSDFHSL